MPKKMYILTDFDGEVFCNNNFIFEIFANNQCPKILKIENENEIKLKIIPFQNKINLTYIAINGKINIKTMTSDCSNFQILSLTKNDYLLKISASRVNPNLSFPLYNKKINGNNISIFNGDKTFFIVQKNNLSTNTEINNNFDAVETINIKKYELFKFYKNEQLSHAIILDNNGNVFLNVPATLIEIEESTLKILSPLNDCFHHAKIMEYEFKKQNEENTFLYADILELKKEYLVILNNPQKLHLNKIPFAFLQCINAKNYKFARNMCSQSLNEQMQDEHFEMFFGNNFEIINFEIDNIIFTINEKNVNSYKFTLLNNKIDNIIRI